MSLVYSTAKAKKYQHLSLKEREFLEIHLSKKDMSVAQIASILCRHRSTIYREIKRGLTLQRKRKKYISSDPLDPGYTEFYAYFSEVGQRVALQRRGCRAGKLKILNDLPLLYYIDHQILVCHYTPEAVIGGLKTHPHPFSYVPHPRSIYHCCHIFLWTLFDSLCKFVDYACSFFNPKAKTSLFLCFGNFIGNTAENAKHNLISHNMYRTSQ